MPVFRVAFGLILRMRSENFALKQKPEIRAKFFYNPKFGLLRELTERPGIIDTPQWMGHGMACAYGTVSKGSAKGKIAVTILLERDRILRRGWVMGSYRLSGPRGFHVDMRTHVRMELNASTNMATGMRR